MFLSGVGKTYYNFRRLRGGKIFTQTKNAEGRDISLLSKPASSLNRISRFWILEAESKLNTLAGGGNTPNLVPRASFPLTNGRKTRALGATISGMRHRYHRCRMRTTQWNRMCRIRLFPLLFQNGCSQSSRFLTAGQGKRSSGNEIGIHQAVQMTRSMRRREKRPSWLVIANTNM